ncbi:MAG: phosphatase PAP2 family protein [Candidatus Diapherotrites archaeon]
MLEIYSFEIIFLQLIQSLSNSLLDLFFLAVTQVGNPALWILISAFFFWNAEERKSFYLMGTVLFASALVGVLKPLIARMRPDESIARIVYQENSVFGFPSGHSAVISSIYFFYEKKLKPKMKLIGFIIVLLVMLSRIYLGVHFFLDVLAGLVLGIFIGKGISLIESKLKGKKLESNKLFEETGLIIAVIILLAGIILEQHPLAGLLAGYFAGIFAFKLMGFDSSKNEFRLMLLKQGIGFCFLGIILAFALTQEYLIKSILFFIAGVFITFIYPILFEKFKGLKKC